MNLFIPFIQDFRSVFMKNFRTRFESGIRLFLSLLEVSGFFAGIHAGKRNAQKDLPFGLIPIRVRARR
jgi:hypothetical protein